MQNEISLFLHRRRKEKLKLFTSIECTTWHCSNYWSPIMSSSSRSILNRLISGLNATRVTKYKCISDLRHLFISKFHGKYRDTFQSTPPPPPSSLLLMKKWPCYRLLGTCYFCEIEFQCNPKITRIKFVRRSFQWNKWNPSDGFPAIKECAATQSDKKFGFLSLPKQFNFHN